MKLAFTLAFALVVLYCNAQDITNGLVAKYTFNNQDIADEIGGVDGTNLGGIFSVGVGGQGQAFTTAGFDNDQIAFIQDPIITLTSDYTISHWFNLDSVNTINHQYTLSSRIDSIGHEQGGVDFLINRDDSTMQVVGRRALSGTATPQTIYEIRSTTKFQTGSWYHVVITKNSSGVKFYLDGVEEDEALVDFAMAGDVSNPYFWNIGAVYHPGSATGLQRELWGRVDEIRFYDRALQQSEVVALYSFEQALSIAEERAEQVRVFPSPTTDVLNVTGSRVERVEIYSLAGEQVHQEMLNGEESVDVSFLPSGVYVVNVINREVSARLKFIKA